MINVPDPRTTAWPRWVAELVLQDPTVPYPPPEHRWREWADRVIGQSTLALLNPPDPRYFTGWRPWAARLKEAADAAT